MKNYLLSILIVTSMTAAAQTEVSAILYEIADAPSAERIEKDINKLWIFIIIGNYRKSGNAYSTAFRHSVASRGNASCPHIAH